MSTLRCPKCDFKFSDGGVGEDWAKVALSTLMAAPAVPDMATQVRCPNCHHLFTEGDIRYLRTASAWRVNTWLEIIGVGVIVWLVCRVFLA